MCVFAGNMAMRSISGGLSCILHMLHMNHPTCTSINPHKYQGREKHVPIIENTCSRKPLLKAITRNIAYSITYVQPFFSSPLSLSLHLHGYHTSIIITPNRLATKMNTQPVTHVDLPDFAARFEGY